MYMDCDVDPTDFGRNCDESDDFANVLNGAGSSMSRDKEEAEEWMTAVIGQLDKRGREFIEAFFEAFKKENNDV